MYVLGSVPDAQKKVEGAGASPCRQKSGNQTARKRLRKCGPRRRDNHFRGPGRETIKLFRTSDKNAKQSRQIRPSTANSQTCNQLWRKTYRQGLRDNAKDRQKMAQQVSPGTTGRAKRIAENTVKLST